MATFNSHTPSVCGNIMDCVLTISPTVTSYVSENIFLFYNRQLAPSTLLLRSRAHIFLQYGALLAVVGIRHPRSPTDSAATLVGAVVALVTDANQGAWTHV